MKQIFIKNLKLATLFIFFILVIQVESAKAGFGIELGTYYSTDKLDSTAELSSGRTIYDFAVMMISDGKRPIGIGWSYIGVSTKEGAQTSTDYSSVETGPKLTYKLGKDQSWHLGLIYNFNAKANFKDALGEAEWRGTSTRFELGYLPSITGKFRCGVKLNMHTAAYAEQVTDSTTLTQTTNTKTLTYPSFALSYMF